MTVRSHPFTLRQLQYAVAVAETLSFRRAAELCRVAQPSLSAQIAALEAAIGVRLFERDQRRVIVTPAGETLLERARSLLVDADDLLQSARAAGDALKGTLRIGIIPTISPYLLPRTTSLLRRSFKALSVVWVEERTHVLLRSLRAGELEAAVLALEAELGEIEHEVFLKDEFLLATPPDHPLAHRRSPVTKQDLHGQSVLLLDEGHCLREQALEWCARSKARELAFRATSLPTLMEMVASGEGVTLLPALAATAEAGRSRLVFRPFAPPAPHRTLALVWRPRSALAGSLREIAGVLRKACSRG